MKTKVKKVLAHDKFPFLLLIVTFLLYSPALFIGWQIDDHFQRLHFTEKDLLPDRERNAWEMFTFITGNPDDELAMKDLGTLPWWSTEGIRASFWRPLTVLTHVIDYSLWPKNPLLMHLQSITWYLGVVFVIWLFYRRFLGATWVAGLAALLFALDQTHGWPVAWIANRNALLALFFGLLTLLIHDSWRRSNWKYGGIIALVCFTLSLLSAEAGLATLAYLFAYVVFLEKRGIKRGLVTLLPYALISIIWFVAYNVQGYGTWGLELYIDPGNEPLRYALAFLKRTPFLLGAQFGFPPAYIYITLKNTAFYVVWFIAVLVVSLYFLALFPLIRKDNVNKFWCLGMLLSVLPICATFPHERLLLFVGVGASAMIARFLESFFEDRTVFSSRRIVQRFVSFVALFWLMAKVIASPLFVPVSVLSPSTMGEDIESVYNAFPANEELRNQELIIVNAPYTYHAMYLPVLRALHNEPFPKRLRILSSHTAPVTIERTDEYTLKITPAEGFIAAPMDDLFRSTSFPFKPGETISLTDLKITILEITESGKPSVASFRFAKPLEDLDYLWFYYFDEKYQTFPLPAVNEKFLRRCKRTN